MSLYASLLRVRRSSKEVPDSETDVDVLTTEKDVCVGGVEKKEETEPDLNAEDDLQKGLEVEAPDFHCEEEPDVEEDEEPELKEFDLYWLVVLIQLHSSWESSIL